jgi:peptidyl-prolyl cis-trans isomerase D
MLKTMRESFHQLKWTLFAVIIVFVLGFVFFSGGGGGSKDASGQVVATVGGDSITAIDFDRQYRQYLDRQQSLYQGNLSPDLIRAMDLPRQVLDGMIDRKLRLAAARRVHLKVSDEEVADMIRSFKGLQDDKGNFIGQEKYERLLASQRPPMSAAQFEEQLREDLLVNKYSALVKSSVLVSDADVQREFSSRNDKASIEYIKVPLSRLESGGEPAEADLKAYYEKHKDRYRTAEQRRIKYLLVERTKVRAKTIVPDAELRAEYEGRKASFGVPEQVVAAHILIKADPAKGPEGEAAAKAKAEKIAERAKKGEDFAKLANENTEDPSGKGSGGALPPFGKGQMVPAFEEAAFAMAPGEIRGPIKTQFGYHVIKLMAKNPARTKSFEEARPQLQGEVSEKRSEAETERRAKALGEKIHGLSNTSDDELRKLQDDVVTYNTSEWIAKGEPITGLGANPTVTGEAWNLKVGQISKEPVATPRGPAFIKPAEERPAGVPPFQEVKARVSQDFLGERREKEAQEKLAPVAKELASGATLASLAGRYETEVKTTPEFGPGGAVPEVGNAPALATAVFATPKGGSGGPVEVPGGFVLFRVLTRTSAEPSLLTAQKPEIVDSLRQKEAERLLRSYLQQMRTEKRVEVNEDLLKSFLPEPGSGRRPPAG